MAVMALGVDPGTMAAPVPDRPEAVTLEVVRDPPMATRVRQAAEEVVTHLVRAMIRAPTISIRIVRAVDPLDHQVTMTPTIPMMRGAILIPPAPTPSRLNLRVLSRKKGNSQ